MTTANSNTPIDYSNIFQQYSIDDLIELWDELVMEYNEREEAKNSKREVDKVKVFNRKDKITGKSLNKGTVFEYLIVRAFELELGEENVKYSYNVSSSIPDSNNTTVEQIDGVVYANSLVSLIECKNHFASIDVTALAKLRNQLMRRPSSIIGSVFSISEFTLPAITLANFMSPQTILLWSRTDIDYALRNEYMVKGLEDKYRHFIEYCATDHALIDLNAK